ncbi:hypothetical protein CENSYa_0677 [Cenarchaeum symbiosum A]|uniref:YokE-like PH domain-containing protein n=1 Tax=Cenarchaeum symbiosum (strain A) TaxID=414004 RepID=A0RVE3_CENSY|nr:hypothetical protein CENSYa_0677 [Cenarchaeum symbiosum A]
MQAFMHADITDPGERRDVSRMAPYLDAGERVLLVARQSRFLPGGSPVAPDVILATDTKLIVCRTVYPGGRRVDYYPYSRITSARLHNGRLSSSMMVAAPGTGRHDRGDGMIRAIPRGKAERIAGLARPRGI